MRTEDSRSGGRSRGGWARLGLWVIASTFALPAPSLAAEGAIACYEEAKREPSVTDLEAVRLCQNADSAAPAECYAQARDRTFLSSHDALRLCTLARSTAPADCAEEAEQETSLTREEVLRLCGEAELWRFP